MGSIEIFNYLPEYLFTDLPRLITAGLTAIGVTFGSVEPPF
ncbi:hypothetical protein [Rhodococcus sp. HNM0569]|nr:hypothetical protein [Rhodococcus sp. HNM0569]